MPPPTSREPGQAEVTDAEAEEWHTHLTMPRTDGKQDDREEFILALLADRTRYREVLRLWDDHLPGCSGSPRCKCGYEEASNLLEENDGEAI